MHHRRVPDEGSVTANDYECQDTPEPPQAVGGKGPSEELLLDVWPYTPGEASASPG
ncbi:hypothetical protein [Paenibacillus elgii]|uniref:hypothetical protein n=1 Tax=Paenibacillus elgii TaxID=189691 RepID=UPI0013D84B39|nr:hypothetical protein [Paenibacillus elgii]